MLSGRVVSANGKPLAGATVAAGAARTATDADGRFMLIANERAYRVSYGGRAAQGFSSDPRRDTEGTWRATFSLTLA